MDSFLDAQAKDEAENAGNMGLRDGDISAASMDLIFAGSVYQRHLISCRCTYYDMIDGTKKVDVSYFLLIKM